MASVLLATICGLPYALGPSAAAAKPPDLSCRTGYTPANPPALSETPDPNIGQFGHRPAVPGRPAWDGDDRVNDSAFIKATNIIYLGGWFEVYVWHGVAYERHNAIAIDATTGEPTNWKPDVDGEILAIRASCTGRSLYLGGSFHHVNGAARNYAARVGSRTGKTYGWDPNPDSIVQDLSIGHRNLIVSGDFTHIGGATRNLIASVNGQTGTATNWLGLSITGFQPEGPGRVTKLVVNNAGTYAVALGNFNRVNTRAHRRIFVLHFTKSGAWLQRWKTPLTKANHNANVGTDCGVDKPSPDLDVAWTPDDSRFATASTGAAQAEGICDTASLWSASREAMTSRENLPLAVQYTGGDTLSAILLTNSLGWTSGHNRWANNPPLNPQVVVQPCSPNQLPIRLGPGYAGYDCKGPTAIDRPGLIGFTLSSMQATSWNPGRSRQRSMHNTMFFTSLGMCIGSDGDDAAGEPHNDLVCFPFVRS